MTQTDPLTTALAARAEDSKNFKKCRWTRCVPVAVLIDTKRLFQTIVKDTLEAFLELEMEEHLGYPKHVCKAAAAAIPAMASTAKPYAETSPGRD